MFSSIKRKVIVYPAIRRIILGTAIAFSTVLFLMLFSPIRTYARDFNEDTYIIWDDDGTYDDYQKRVLTISFNKGGSYESIEVNPANKTVNIKNTNCTTCTLVGTPGWIYIFFFFNTFGELHVENDCTIKMKSGAIISTLDCLSQKRNEQHTVNLDDSNAVVNSVYCTNSFVVTEGHRRVLDDGLNYIAKDYIFAKDRMPLYDNCLVMVKTRYQQNGSPITPEYSVVFNGRTLTENVDYTVELNQNVNGPYPYITITGIGKCYGTIYRHFEIYTNHGKTFNVNGLIFRIQNYTDAKLYGCSSDKKNIIIPSRVHFDGVDYSVTNIRSSAFKKQNIKKVVIPASVKAIGLSAFQNCKKLKKITIYGNNITRIDADAFKNIHPNAAFTIKVKDKKTYKALVKKIKKSTNVKTVTFKYKKSK